MSFQSKDDFPKGLLDNLGDIGKNWGFALIFHGSNYNFRDFLYFKALFLFF